jgi:hypothetical protein
MDKKWKKELRKQARQREEAAARQTLGLLPDQLRDLHDELGRSIEGLGIPCDHTPSRTRAWATRNGLDLERVCEGVRAFGGCCDCEVVLNVTPDQFGFDCLSGDQEGK